MWVSSLVDLTTVWKTGSTFLTLAGAKGSLTDALVACMSTPSMINLATIEAATDAYASSGKIDPLSNVKDHVCSLLNAFSRRPESLHLFWN